ncbi:MAG: thioredoxin family protein [bacterium]|nr:thioredoxin family protein [bacterium]
MKLKGVKILIFGAILLSLAGILSTIDARDRSPRSADKRFHRLIKRQELAVVMFYNRNGSRASTLESMFSATSRKPSYRDAEVEFLTINVAKERSSSLARDFDVRQVPAFIVFKDGIPVSKEHLSGFVSREQLTSFIDKHIEDRIKDIIEEKAEARKRAAEERRYYRPYIGFSYGYPYYGYPYYGYPYYGSGWGYPYYWGRGYRPYGGVGFSFGF